MSKCIKNYPLINFYAHFIYSFMNLVLPANTYLLLSNFSTIKHI